MPSPKPYTGPVVFITDAMYTRDRPFEEKDQIVRQQEKFHEAKILKLLRFANRHGLPVLIYFESANDKKLLFKLAETAGLPKRQMAEFNPEGEIQWESQFAARFKPTVVIHSGMFRNICIDGSIDDAKRLWPSAKQVLLTGSYSVLGPGAFRKSKDKPNRLRGESQASMKEKRVIFTSKLGPYLLNPAWPEILAQARKNSMPKRPKKAQRAPIVPRRALRNSAHRL
ncbi:MAG: hypothetical protein NT067_06040 [Candidatus Diapherotrites archaeon]|nr:hypothetical protein [Candidatus Diapherotrites archaeon]